MSRHYVHCILVALAAFSPACLTAESPTPLTCTASQHSFTNVTDGNILDNTTLTQTIAVSGIPNYLWDLDLTLFITHTFSGDLDITLTSPAGTVVTITSDNGGTADNVFNGTKFDDSANLAGLPPYTGGNQGLVSETTYSNLTVKPLLAPEEPLGAFIGENPNGTWTLRIFDDAGADTGLLDKWTLDFTAFQTSAVVNQGVHTFNSNNIIPIPDNSPASFATSSINITNVTGTVCGVDVYTSILHPSNSDLQIALVGPNGNVASLASNDGTGFSNGFSDTHWKMNADPGNQVPFPSNAFAGSQIVTDTVFASGTPKPNLTPTESLASLYGISPQGTWTLRVADTTATNSGSIQSWGVSLTTCQSEADSDGDGLANNCDSCPSDSAKVLPGVCGCGVADIDSDGDGTLNCLETCPADPTKLSPGVCGCGIADTDSDSDTVADCNDACPTNNTLTSVGVCGCTTPVDANGNGVPECKVNEELVTRLTALQSLVKKITSASSKSQKTLRTKFKTALSNDILAFTNQNTGQLTVKANSQTIAKQTNTLKSLGAKFLKIKKTFAADKKLLTKAILNLKSSIVL